MDKTRKRIQKETLKMAKDLHSTGMMSDYELKRFKNLNKALEFLLTWQPSEKDKEK